jgi:hypothetical protein
VQVDRSAVGAPRRQRGRQRRRRVDDEQVSGREDGGQVEHARVREATARAVGHEHADLVAAQPARLGRLAGLQPGGQLEGRDRAHAPTAGCSALACQRPLA